MKYRQIGFLFSCIAVVLSFEACSATKILNPYSESFGCKPGFYGDCSSVRQAYEKSIAESESEQFSPLVTRGKDSIQYPVQSEGIAKIKGESLVPDVARIKKYRVFIPGYVVDSKFYGRRNIYYIIDEPAWELK